jgi:peptidoglycan/xylan/chitin deacetylase (PgdA/CDA1 family)
MRLQLRVLVLIKKCLPVLGLIALVSAAAAVGSCSHLNAGERTVAITFDDLPMANSDQFAEKQTVATVTNKKIMTALKRYRAPATGFVNEAHVKNLGASGVQLLTSWNQGRYELGNHGATHADTNRIDINMLEKEIVEGEASIAPLARSNGRSIKFFRFPYNHLGETAEKQAGALALLQTKGYRLAAATIDTSDYVFDAAFEQALAAGDTLMQRRIKEAYLEHTEKQIAYYGALNRQVLGYEPPAIMLLHINRLNGETLEGQLALFRKAGYRFISLTQAQADPAYAQPPRNHTRFGPMWGYRWAIDRGVRVNGSLEEEPPSWITEYTSARRSTISSPRRIR